MRRRFKNGLQISSGSRGAGAIYRRIKLKSGRHCCQLQLPPTNHVLRARGHHRDAVRRAAADRDDDNNRGIRQGNFLSLSHTDTDMSAHVWPSVTIIVCIRSRSAWRAKQGSDA